jgi:phosphomannomutase
MSTGVKSPLNLPKSNVIKYYLAGVDAWAVLRPSGTEPKLKIYLEACDSDKEVSKSIVKALDDEFTLKIKELTGNA